MTSVTVVEGDTTVVTVTTAGPQGATGATGTVAAAASGTAAAPGISFTSDPNTGIYNPSADNLSFSTGGVQRLSIASDGTVNVVGNLTEGGNNVVSVGDTGTVTSTMILDGTIVDADINASAAIVDTKLATISTAGKVSNSATTATNANTASAIVARDGSGNFSAGTITAALTGAASSNVLKAGDTMTGPLLVPAGTAALPGLAVSGDPNTGIYSPGADQVAISTGGTGRLFVDASGNIGVGATTAYVTAANRGNISINGTDSILAFGNSGVLSSYIYSSSSVTEISTESRPLVIKLAGSERLRITAAGLVGIGTSAPGVPLDVVGTIRSSTTVTAGSDFRLNNNSFSRIAHSNGSGGFVGGYNVKFATGVKHDSTGNISAVYYDNNGVLRFYTNTSQVADTAGQERLTITAAGLVGIGTSAPGSTLEVNGTLTTQGNIFASSGGATRTITLGSTGAGLEYNVDGTTYLGGRTDAYPLVLRTNSAERLRITSTGNVGIGTSSPGEKLHVLGGNARIGSPDTIYTQGSTVFVSAGWGSNSAPAYGNLSFIGYADQVKGRIRSVDYSVNNVNAGGLFFDVQTGAATVSQAMAIDSSGRVGIGTSAPSVGERLSVRVAAGGVSASFGDDTYSTFKISHAETSGTITFLNGGNTPYLKLGSATQFYTAGNVETARIDSSGRLLVGTSTALTNGDNSSSARLQVNTSAYYGADVGQYSANEYGSIVYLQKSRNASIGSHTAVLNGDQIGEMRFAASDGTRFRNAAIIGSYVDGSTISSTSMPGLLTFSTTASGSTSPTTRLLINSVGQTMVNSAGSAVAPVISKVDDPNTGIFFPAADTLAFAEGGTEAARIDSSGRLLVGTSSSPAGGQGSISRLVVQGFVGANSGLGILSLQRGETAATITANEAIGEIAFNDSDGFRFASIQASADANAGGNDYPGRLVFSTTADAAAAPTERMRIDSSGRLLVGVTNTYGGASVLYPSSTGVIDLATSVANNPAVLKLGNIGFSNTAEYSTGAVEFRGFDSVGNVIGYASVEGLVTDATAATRKGSIVFKTISASTVSEKMRIDSTGLVTLAGPGIKFPATQVASADPNTLDDYEEGTFTPTVAGTSTEGTASYAVQSARYSKIGRVVYFEMYVNWSAGTGTGNLTIKGLPFTSSNTQTYPGVNIGYINNVALLANNYATAQVDNNANVVRLKQSPVGGGTAVDVAYDADAAVTLSGIYTV